MKKTNFTDRFRLERFYNPILGLMLFSFLFLLQGQLNAQCSPQCKSSNISVGADCIATVNLTEVMNITTLCGPTWRLNLKATMNGPILETVDNGLLIVDGTTPAGVSYDYIGQTLVLEYVDLTTGNSCWNWHLFEDKLPPVIDCSTDTIPCYVDVNFANIDLQDCSAPVVPHIISMITEELACIPANDGLLRRVTRTYYAEDASGNKSDTCIDTILVARPNLDSITWPVSDTVYCDDDYAKDGNGNPAPSETGVPTIGADAYPLFPNELLQICNLYTNYTDEVIDLGCSVKIRRKWTVDEGCCNEDNHAERVQIICIQDTLPPVLTVPDDFTVNTNNSDCSATVTIPAASATDNCKTNLNWTVVYPGGFKNQNGGFSVNLPVGVHTIQYIVNDGCNYSSTGEMTITVVDNVAPNAVCIEYTVASIPNGSNFVRVYASSFDNGSWDNCGPVTFKVARMNPDCNDDQDKQITERDFIDFYCCDVSQTDYVQIRFFVYDASGNKSECMVNVKVQDKTMPIMTIPPDMWVPCEFEYNPDNLGLTFGYVLTDGSTRRQDTIYTDDKGHFVVTYLDGYATDNCSVDLGEVVNYDFDDCGSGTITRTFTATDPFGNTVSRTQKIHIYKTPLNVVQDAMFIAPKDTMFVDGPCVVDNLQPDDLPAQFTPRFIGNPVTTCFNLAYSYHDEVFYGVQDACFKIIRTWKVMDWCYASVYGIDAALATAATFHHVIKVKNTIAPVFAQVADITAISQDSDCFNEYVSVSNTATDDCTPANLINYSYKIDYNYAVNGVPTWDKQGSGNDASGLFPLGVHRVCFYATDHCGNVGESCIIVTVLNQKKPTPVAHHLVTEIMPSAGMIVLPAWYFDAGSFANCGGPLKFSFSSDVNDTLKTFTCDDIGNNPPASVEFWVTDQFGNQDYVVVPVVIQDNNNVCDGTLTTFVAGNIVTENSLGIPKVHVTGAGNTNTSNDGVFKFNSINPGTSYTITPKSERDPLNGVETGDIIKIQNHILNKKALDGPYKIIAADVNMDNKVNVQDIVNIRKLILGKVDQLPSGESWRFIDKKFTFADPQNPFKSAFPEEVTVTPSGTINNVDFFGVKLGDVNNNVTLNFGGDDVIDVRSNETVTFTSQDQLIPAGVPTQVTLKADNFGKVEGFQMAIAAAQGVKVTNVTSNDLKFTDDNYNVLNNQTTRMSWNNDNAGQSEGSVTMTLVSNRDIQLSEALSILTNDLKPAAYDNNGTEMNVALQFTNTNTDGVTVFQNRPNPFSDETRIGVNLPENMDVTLKVYDINGRTIYQSTNHYAKGANEIVINSDMISANGVLFYEISTKYGTEMRKMIRLKN